MSEPNKVRELAGAGAFLVSAMLVMNVLLFGIVAIVDNDLLTNPLVFLALLAFGFFGARYAARYIGWPIANWVAGADR